MGLLFSFSVTFPLLSISLGLLFSVFCLEIWGYPILQYIPASVPTSMAKQWEAREKNNVGPTLLEPQFHQLVRKSPYFQLFNSHKLLLLLHTADIMGLLTVWGKVEQRK